jgi:D-alanyl-D-alanine carboxypeptidase/D-alanyl-D-alanine-endopeptidase (penicillin-binding protein 4)
MNIFRSERFFVTVMCEKLAARGVSVGSVVYAASPDTFELLHCKKRSILDVVDEALKESNNLCAEALTFHLGALYGHRPVAHKDGTNIIKGFLDFNLNMPAKYEIADGSGLSLYTYISADIMLQVLRRIYSNQPVYEAVLRGLPIAGWTGTLKGRMAGTAAERKIHAKTGTVSGICTLAGYAEARSGHTLAFVIFNQGIMTPRLARRWQNKVCELLCR